MFQHALLLVMPSFKLSFDFYVVMDYNKSQMALGASLLTMKIKNLSQ